MNKTVKILSFILALTLLAAMFSACTNSPATSAPASTAAPAEGSAAPADAPSVGGLRGSPDETYYTVVFVSGVEYWFPVYAAFKQCGNQLGVQTFYMGCPEYDANKEVEVFNNVLAMNPTGIFLSPITAEAFKEPIDRAVDSGVAIVTMASDSPDSKRQGYITSDNVKEGTYAARTMAEDMGGKGKVMTLCNPGQTNHDIRTDTFKAVIESEYPDIEFIGTTPTNQDPDKAYAAVMTAAQQHPDLGGVFMPEASSAMGAAQAAVELNTGIRVMCCDVNTAILDLLKSGQMFGAINPDQGMQGYFGMLTLFIIAHPELVDPMSHKKAMGMNPTYIPYIDNGLNVVTGETADYYYVDKYATSIGYKSVEDMLSPGKPS